MTRQTQASSLPRTSLWRTVFALTATFVVIAVGTPAAQAQTFSVLHYFTGGADGGIPTAGVTIGGPGTLYGTTTYGGEGCYFGCGVVYKLAQRGSGWTVYPLYEFTGVSQDGANPYAGVVIGQNGALYGTTFEGGTWGFGSVFEVKPPVTACKTAICYWNETQLYSFQGFANDGAAPYLGNLIFDSAGNIYGTTYGGGTGGTAYELTPTFDGQWIEGLIYDFSDGPGGRYIYSGVIFDTAGNLYGTNTAAGANGYGVVYELMPGPPWTEKILANFDASTTGAPAYGTLVMDQSGNFYGTTEDNGPGGAGTVYKVSQSNGSWTFSLVYAFSGSLSCNPYAGVTLGSDGNLYGVCQLGGAHGDGWVFEMPPTCNQTCTPADLHDFDFTDGNFPLGAVAFDSNGNLYGTCYGGGNTGGNCGGNGCGTVWELEGIINRR